MDRLSPSSFSLSSPPRKRRKRAVKIVLPAELGPEPGSGDCSLYKGELFFDEDGRWTPSLWNLFLLAYAFLDIDGN